MVEITHIVKTNAGDKYSGDLDGPLFPLQYFKVFKKKSVNPGNRPNCVKICGRNLLH